MDCMAEGVNSGFNLSRYRTLRPVQRMRILKFHWFVRFRFESVRMQFPYSLPAAWRRRLRWAAISVVLLWLLAWLIVPPVAKRLMEEKGSAALGRQVTVGAVSFRPWSLEITVSDIAVANAEGNGKQLSIARLYADAELVSIFHMAPVLDAVTIDAPTLHVTHFGDGRYDFDDILHTLQKAPTPGSGSPPASASAPLPFALYNLTLHGGAIDFHDRAPGGERSHAVRALELAVPFLSTLESKREVKVVPHLAFELNGSRFDTAAEGTPFAQTHKSDATLKIVHLDLAPYLPYLPSSLPLRLQSAVVDADVHLAFEQAARQKVALSGMFKLSHVKLADARGNPMLDVASLDARLADVRPLDRVVALASLQIDAPKLYAGRDSAGHINWLFENTASTSHAAEIAAARAPASATASQPTAKSATAAQAPVWTMSLERFALHQGEVTWSDDSLQPHARLALAQMELNAQAVHWPLVASNTSFDGAATLPGAAGRTARLGFEGMAAQTAASVHATLDGLDLGLAAPYAAQFLQPGVRGMLDGEVEGNWRDGKLLLSLPHLSIRDFALTPGKDVAVAATATANTAADRAAGDMPRFKQLEISDVHLDLAAKTGDVGKITLHAPSAMLYRDAQGQWRAQRWLKTQAKTDDSAPAAWQFALKELSVDDGSVRLDDRSLARPVRLEVSALKLQLQNATVDGSKPAPLNVSAKVKSGRTEAGTLNYRGSVMWAPVTVQGTVGLVDIPLHAVAPYFADQLNIAVLRADASFKGQVRYCATPTGPELQLQGDAALEDFRANTVGAITAATAGSATTIAATAPGNAVADSADLGVAEELLSWKSLSVPGVALTMSPGSATRIQVREAVLSDFFARIIVNADGRLNLQDLVKATPAVAGTNGPAASASAPASASEPASSATPPAVVTVGPIKLVNGKVLFSDRFIRPNYTADLTELNGSLSQFSSQTQGGAVQMADLLLRGRAEGTASLEVAGKINPLAKPLALDIQGHVRDLDLPPLTAYSVKYAGYGIERGKLSMDVTYTVQPDGQLSASNKLVLNQLTFGDEVKGAPNSLPVKLAVALLADSDGVIDIDLPISGSLNDPQFRFGSVIFKVITNLIGKALTSPFSLLSHAFGGGTSGDERSVVAFAPGSASLTPAVAQGLDQVAKVLSDRTVLQITVVGTANLAQEHDALQRERLKGLLLSEKRRRAVLSGQDAAAQTDISEADYPVLLKEVYRRADITKPRNVLGIVKDIPTVEMEALLLASIKITEDSMRELALQRGVVVKDYLASRKLGPERLFLGAGKTDAAETDWKPHAELSLSHR